MSSDAMLIHIQAFTPTVFIFRHHGCHNTSNHADAYRPLRRAKWSHDAWRRCAQLSRCAVIRDSSDQFTARALTASLAAADFWSHVVVR